MIKKHYIKPQIETIVLKTSTALLTGSTEQKPDITDKGGSGSDPNTAKEHDFLEEEEALWEDDTLDEDNW